MSSGGGCVKRIEHIGVAVRDIEAAIAFYGETLGLELLGREVLTDLSVEVALFRIGDTKIELLAALGGKGTIGRFLEKRGEGVHHICFEVDRLVDRLAEFEARGYRCIEGPQPGAEGKTVCFLSPRATFGVLVELAEMPGKSRTG
jgi:methylmalonyl-CoA/ethylmalonyl-CoA epimerase